MKTSEILREARKRIDAPEKWTKRIPLSSGQHCAVTACGSRYISDDVAQRAAWDALRKQMPVDGPLFRYNDDPSTTHADIMALYDRAIAACEAKGD